MNDKLVEFLKTAFIEEEIDALARDHFPRILLLFDTSRAAAFFGLAGLGRTVFDSITGRDYMVIQGIGLVVAIIFVIVNLITDISYAFLDPRVRLS